MQVRLTEESGRPLAKRQGQQLTVEHRLDYVAVKHEPRFRTYVSAWPTVSRHHHASKDLQSASTSDASVLRRAGGAGCVYLGLNLR
jgi:hypothetical protein